MTHRKLLPISVNYELPVPAPTNEERAHAIQWLKNFLRGNRYAAQEVAKAAFNAGFDWRAVKYAAFRLGLPSYRRYAYWQLKGGTNDGANHSQALPGRTGDNYQDSSSGTPHEHRRCEGGAGTDSENPRPLERSQLSTAEDPLLKEKP